MPGGVKGCRREGCPR